MKSFIYKDKKITPSKVICIGRNYKEHIKELKNELPDSMVLFLKPNSAITNELFYFNENTHYECEITFLIKDTKIVAAGIGFDLTKRDVQDNLKQKGLPWERAKAFDNSAVFSEFVEIDKIDELNFELFINDELKQKGSIKEMIYHPLKIIEEVGTFMSFEDNDIIMSGTPKGVGSYKKDDNFFAKLYDGEKLILQKEWRVI